MQRMSLAGFWCGLAVLSASEFHTVRANSGDAVFGVTGEAGFALPLDYSDYTTCL